MAAEQSPPSLLAEDKLETPQGAHTSPRSSRTESSSTTTNLRDGKDPQDSETEKDRDVERGIPVVDTTEDADVHPPAAEQGDPNIVDWDPGDPEKAMNWPAKKIAVNMVIVSTVTFLTPLASSMAAPGEPLIMRDLHSTSETLASFVISIYLLGYASGPLVIAPLSEIYGRLPVYWVNNIMFTAWTIGCALAPNIGGLIALRFFAGVAGSCPLAIGAGSIADMFPQERRGMGMSIFALGPLLGPVIGPVAGGYLAQDEGWRWVFWVIAIGSGAITVASFIFMKETYEPVLLERKAARLRKETDNPNLRSRLASDKTPAEYFKLSIIRPTKMLIFSPIVLCLSVYIAVVYGYLYLLFTTLTLVFQSAYHFSQGDVGLSYLGIGIGALVGITVFGFASDRIVKRLAAGGEMKPEYRLPLLMPGGLLIPIGLFLYGWSAEERTHWIVPIIGTFFVGLGLLGIFMPIQTYLVDAYTIHAASAVAANTVLRSLVGCFLPLAGPAMYQRLGLGWGNSLLGFIGLALTPLGWIFYAYGERIRKSPRFQVKF